MAAPEVFRAVQTVNELRARVEAGVASRHELEQAEAVLADADDAEFIHRMLQDGDLTEEDAAAVKSAAKRRLDRVQANIEQKQRLVDAGILATHAMMPLIEEKRWAQTQYDLALLHADLVHQIAEMALAEQQRSETADTPSLDNNPTVDQAMERFDGTAAFGPDDFKKVQTAFEKEFTKPLPISAHGETAVHRAMHFDHSNRVDVAVVPDTPEGLWLRQYLERSNIPYYAFRRPIPGKATGAHIHIGAPSTKI